MCTSRKKAHARTWIFGLLIALTTAFTVVMNALLLWGAVQMGQVVARNDSTLDLNGFVMITGTVGLVLWKLSAPAIVKPCGSRFWLSGLLLWIVWIMSLLVSSLLAVITLAKLVPCLFVAPEYFILAAVAWTVCDGLISLMPLVIQELRNPLPVDGEWHVRSREIHKFQADEKTGHPDGPTAIAKKIHACLCRLAEAGPGRFEGGLVVLEDFTIIASQGALADLNGCSKSAINRALHALRDSGHIDLMPLSRETRIKVITRIKGQS